MNVIDDQFASIVGCSIVYVDWNVRYFAGDIEVLVDNDVTLDLFAHDADTFIKFEGHVA